jgi:hypothetical protein
MWIKESSLLRIAPHLDLPPKIRSGGSAIGGGSDTLAEPVFVE